MPRPTKLYIKRLPTLRGRNPSVKDIALWLLRLKRWAQTNGFQPYMFQVPPALGTTVEHDEMIQDAMRYLDHAIENEKLSGDLADLPNVNAYST